MATTNQKSNTDLKPGDLAILSESDSFGTTTTVRVLKLFKGGNALVLDGEHRREVGQSSLKPLSRAHT